MTTLFSFKKVLFGILILLFAGFFWLSMQTCQKTGTGLNQASDTTTGAPGKLGDSAAELKDKTVAMASDAAKSAGSIIENAAEKSGTTLEAAGETAKKAADKAGEAYQAVSEMADNAADKVAETYRSAGEIAGNAAEKADAAGRTAGEMAGSKVTENAGEPSLTVGEMAGNVTDKAAKTYKPAGDMADKTPEKVGEQNQSAGTATAGAIVESGKAHLAAISMADKTGEKTDMTTAPAVKKDGDASVLEAGENTKGQLVEVAANYKAEGHSGAPLTAAKGPTVTAAGTWLYEDVKFDYNRSDLKPGALASLSELAATLKARPELNIEIQGHTDSSGGREYNLELSKRRAQSVKSYLESQGIAAARMTVKGFGPDRPLFGNASKEDFARNRRVEIKPIN